MTNASYENYPIKDNQEPLVDLNKFNFILEPCYFKQGFTTDSRMFLRESVAKKLAEAQEELKIYKFKIWDGFRSRETQNNIYKNFWKELQEQHRDWDDTRLKEEVGVFITSADNPYRIPPHATGGAVDLTLVDKNGDELNMGTGFDYFGYEAQSSYFDENNLNETIRQNRKVLRDILFAKDFIEYSEEWWHFDYGNQLWAIELHRPFAIYGEALLPK